MVGEQMAVTLGITAAGPISQLEVVVKAEYLEGGGHSELQILLPDAEEDRPSLQVRLFYSEGTTKRMLDMFVQCLAQLCLNHYIVPCLLLLSDIMKS